MQKQTGKATPKATAEMIERLEKGERESKDPAEKERLSRLAASLRNVIVSFFVKRASDTDETDRKRED